MYSLLRPMAALSLFMFATIGSAHAAYPWPAYSVVPIYFVPKDWDVNSAEVQAEAAALRSAMVEIRQFYARALGGNTFLLNDLVVLQANGPKEAYGIQWTGGDIYADGITISNYFVNHLMDELGPRGYPFTGQAINGYAVVIFVKGAGGFAGGNGYGETGDGGYAVLGDWAIDSLEGQLVEGQYAWRSGRTPQLGAVAHELGHAFSLLDTGDWGGPDVGMLMGRWYEYPNVGFADYENNLLNQTRLKYFSQCLPPVPLDPAPAVKPYELHILPTLGADTWALRINETGWISGSSGSTSATGHQVVFDPELKIHDLGGGGGFMAEATAINDHNVVTGYWEAPSRTRRATFSIFDTVTKQWTTKELAVPPTAGNPVACDINNSATIVGGTSEFNGNATVWSGANVLTSALGSQSLAQSINNHNQIVGRFVGPNGQRAFLWNDNGNGTADPGEWMDLGVANTLPQAYTEAFSINDRGQVTGSVYDGGMGRRAAFSLTPQDDKYFVDAGNGTNALIKTLPRLGRGLDYAIDVNNQGVVVGRSGVCSGFFDFHAALWQNGKVSDLNDLVAPQAGVTLTSAESINNAGEIVGRAMTSAGHRAFLLRPIVPPPPPIAAALAAQANSIVLNWQDRSRNEWGFEIERRVGIDPATSGPEDGWSPLITVGPNVVTFTDSSLLPSMNYQYRIRAFNDNGSSGYQVSQAVQTRQNRSPIATADSYSMSEDKALKVAAAKGLLVNDRDPDGDPLSVTQIRSAPEHGQLQWSADGSFIYTPEHNYAGTDRFEYVVRDTAGGESSAAVTLSVSNKPDRPHAHHDSYRTVKNTKLCIKSPGVLSNDEGADHDKLRAVLHKGPHHGSLDLEKNGSFCYRPYDGFHGEDHFTYYAVDKSSRKDDAKVTIHVDKHRD